MEITQGAYSLKEILGGISYADGMRLINQDWLDQDRDHYLQFTDSTTRYNRKVWG